MFHFPIVKVGPLPPPPPSHLLTLIVLPLLIWNDREEGDLIIGGSCVGSLFHLFKTNLNHLPLSPPLPPSPLGWPRLLQWKVLFTRAAGQRWGKGSTTSTSEARCWWYFLTILLCYEVTRHWGGGGVNTQEQ